MSLIENLERQIGSAKTNRSIINFRAGEIFGLEFAIRRATEAKKQILAKLDKEFLQDYIALQTSIINRVIEILNEELGGE